MKIVFRDIGKVEQMELAPDDYAYDSAQRGPLAVEELRGVLEYADLICQLVQRDIVARYKRSILGVAWTLLNPLGMMLVMTIVFSQLFHSVISYPTYLLSGLIAWTFFSQSTSSSLQQTVWGSALLHRIYIPRTTFVIAAIATGLVNLILSFIPLLVIMFLTGTPLRWSVIVVPVGILLLACFSLGIGLLLSAITMYFPDTADMYQVGLVAWMYLTPIIYPVGVIPEAYRDWLLYLNPMYYLIEIFRQPLYDGVFPAWPMLAIGASVSFLMLIVGWLVFSSKADEFTYRT